MKNPFVLLMLTVLFVLIGCDDSSTTPDKIKLFDSAQAQKNYADMDFSVLDISEQSYKNGSAIAVSLSVPLDPTRDFQSFFSLTQNEQSKTPGAWVLADNGLTVYFPDIEPSQTYTVEVLAGLESVTGKKLPVPVSDLVKTRDLSPQVSFASQGFVLPAGLHRGLPVTSVNINAVDINFHRIDPDQIARFLNHWNEHSHAQSYYQLQEYAQYTDLVYTGRFDLNPPKNQYHTTHINLQAIKVLQEPGVYLAVMKPAGSYDYEQQVTFFTISDIGLHARFYRQHLWILSSSLKEGSALPNVALQLIDEKQNILAEASTDAKGQATFRSAYAKARFLLARQGNHIGLLKLKGPTLDLTEFDITGRSYQPVDVFLYGPRDLYRPGETVKINALLRNSDGESIPALPLKAVLKRPDGQKVKFFTWQAEANQAPGFYQTEFQLSDQAQTGQWTLQIQIAGRHSHEYTFQVEAFLPERMELQLGEPNVSPEPLSPDQTLKLAVSGQYLYGAPAEKNRLSSRLVMKPNRHPVEAFKAYFFGLADDKAPVDSFAADDIYLDANGTGEVSIPSRWESVRHTPFALKVIASLYETGGRPVTRTQAFTLWPQQHLIGIKPEADPDEIPSETRVNFDLILSDFFGQLSGDSEVLATLIKERKDYYWEYSDSEGWHYETTDHHYQTFEQRLTLDAKQPTRISVPVEWGWYVLKVENLATGQQSSLRFRAGSGWGHDSQADKARPDRVMLIMDEKSYAAGDTLNLSVVPPYPGQGWVSVESNDGILWMERVNVPADGLKLAIPIAKDWSRHDLYVTSTLFRPGEAKENITPNRAIGIAHLALKRDDRQLEVKIEAPDGVVRPDREVSIPIHIANAAAQEKVYVTLAAVDVGVLNITDFKTPDPYMWFFAQRGYQVDQRDMYGKIIELISGDSINPSFGGDADHHAGGERPDTSVQIVSLFSDVVVTDAEGRATIKLNLPDFNGRLRLMALAFSERRMGASEQDMTVAAPVISEVSLPRFMANQDESVLTLDVRNQSGETQQLTLNMTATGAVTMAAEPVTFALQDQEKRVFTWPLTAGEGFGQADIALNLSNQDQSITQQKHWQLGVRPSYAGRTYQQRQQVNAGQKAILQPPLSDILLASAHSDLLISSQPPIPVKEHLQSLLNYPYGCLEQTISTTYPWLMIDAENMKRFGLETLKIHNKPIDLAKKPQILQKGLEMLAAMQRSNGSFGLWSNQDSEEHWLTAYAVDFLLDAREQGVTVPDEVLLPALKRLGQYIHQRGSMYGERYSQKPEHYTLAYKAYAAYVLARLNQASLGHLRTLYDHYHQNSQSGLPLLHLGLALWMQGDKERGLAAIEKSIQFPRPEETIYLGDYGSRLRDLAVMVTLLDKHPVPLDQTQSVVFALADELNNRDYVSTQERNALFRAGVRLSANATIPWQGRLLWKDQSVNLTQTVDYQLHWQGNDIPARFEFQAAAESEKPVYISLQTQGYPVKPPAEKKDDIQIERNYYDLQGNLIEIGQHQVGDVLMVQVSVVAKQRIKDALLVDFLPAGFELENQNLSNTVNINDLKIQGESSIADLTDGNWNVHEQFLDDRYAVALDLREDNPRHFFYLMRAVTTGRYVTPSPYVEDMYRPYIYGVGRAFDPVTIVAK